MGFYIKSNDLGLFVGECLGFGFFTKHIIDGTLGVREKPVKFDTKNQAEEYLNTWVGGRVGCYVVEMTDEEVEEFMENV